MLVDGDYAFDLIRQAPNGQAGDISQPIVSDLRDPASWKNRAVAEAFKKLSPEHQAVLSLLATGEPPATDSSIAEAFGIPLNTAKSRRRAALNHLRKALGIEISVPSNQAKEG